MKTGNYPSYYRTFRHRHTDCILTFLITSPYNNTTPGKGGVCIQDYKFAYIPKQKPLTCRPVFRSIGPTTDKIHMHNSGELTLITTKASALVVSNGNTFRIQTPALVWSREGSFHELLEVCQQDISCIVCFYKPQLLAGIPAELRYQQLFANADLLVFQLNEHQLDSLLPWFHLLQTVPLSQGRFLLLCLFDQLQQLVASGLNPIRSGTTLTYIFEVAALLQNPDQEKLTLEALANRFHVSASKLKTDFKKVTNMPLHAFRRHVQLQSARILLETTNQELAQIAYTCGFTDESYFIRAFRKEFGITPGNYRKQLNK